MRQVWHEAGPFAGIQDGDQVLVKSGDREIAKILVASVKRFSMAGTDVDSKAEVKVTHVSTDPTRQGQLRCAIRLGPGRFRTQRDVEVRKI